VKSPAEGVCSQNKTAFGNKILCRGTTARRMEEMNIYFLTQLHDTRMYQKVSGLAAWSENCKWYSSLPLDAVVSLLFETF